MRILSAANAISPAFTRTKAVFFQPFRKGRSWKLAATAYLSMMGCVFLPIPLLLFLLPAIHKRASGKFALVFAILITVYTVVMWVFFYIGARLQFVLFDIVLRKLEFVAPGWRFYRPHAWRWIGLKVAVGTTLSLIAGIPLAFWILRVMPQFTMQPGQPPSPHIFGTILQMDFALCGVMGLVFLASSLLADFVLPYIALEDASVSIAFRRFAQLIEAEPGQMLLFIFFKVLLAIASIVALQIVIVLMEILIAIPLGIVGFFGWLFLHHLGLAGALLMTVGAILLYITFAAAIFYFVLALHGAIITFFQAYALYFLGGRYPILGDLLEPPYAAAFPITPAPPSPPPEPA